MMDKDSKDLFGCIGIIVGALVAMLVAGYALSVAWTWFIVPLGVPGLSIPQAIGITFVVAFFKDRKPKDNEKAIVTIGSEIVSPLLLLGVAWIIQLFM